MGKTGMSLLANFQLIDQIFKTLKLLFIVVLFLGVLLIGFKLSFSTFYMIRLIIRWRNLKIFDLKFCVIQWLFFLPLIFVLIVANENLLVFGLSRVRVVIIHHVKNCIKREIIGRSDLLKPIVFSVVNDADDINIALVRYFRALLLHSLNPPILVKIQILRVLLRLLSLDGHLRIHIPSLFTHLQ